MKYNPSRSFLIKAVFTIFIWGAVGWLYGGNSCVSAAAQIDVTGTCSPSNFSMNTVISNFNVGQIVNVNINYKTYSNGTPVEEYNDSSFSSYGWDCTNAGCSTSGSSPPLPITSSHSYSSGYNPSSPYQAEITITYQRGGFLGDDNIVMNTQVCTHSGGASCGIYYSLCDPSAPVGGAGRCCDEDPNVGLPLTCTYGFHPSPPAGFKYFCDHPAATCNLTGQQCDPALNDCCAGHGDCVNLANVGYRCSGPLGSLCNPNDPTNSTCSALCEHGGYCQGTGNPNEGICICNADVVYDGPIVDIGLLFATVAKILYPAGIIVGTLNLGQGLYMLMTSTGDPRKKQFAKDKLIATIAGVVFLITSLLILRLLINTLITTI